MSATVTELGPNMSLEDRRKEAKSRLEQASEIEQRHTGPGAEPLTGADLERVKQLLAEVDALHVQIEAAGGGAGPLREDAAAPRPLRQARLPPPTQPGAGREGPDRRPGHAVHPQRGLPGGEERRAVQLAAQPDGVRRAHGGRHLPAGVEGDPGRHGGGRGPGAHGRALHHRGHPAQDHQRAGPAAPGADRVATPSSTSSRRRAPSTSPSWPRPPARPARARTGSSRRAPWSTPT